MLFFYMFINTKFHNLRYFVAFKQIWFLNKDNWVSGFSAPPILKLFVCFLCVTPKYRWLGRIYYFVLSYVVCPHFAFLSVSSCPSFFYRFDFTFCLWKPELSSTVYQTWAQKMFVFLSNFLHKFHAKTAPNQFHTFSNLLHWILTFLELFPWGKWNAEYEGCCLLISQLRKFGFGECILNNYTRK